MPEKTVRLPVYLTETERETIKEIADKEGYKRDSDFVRSVLADYLADRGYQKRQFANKGGARPGAGRPRQPQAS